MDQTKDQRAVDSRRVVVHYVQGGRPETVEVDVPDTGEPEEQQRQEVRHFVQTLVDNGQLDGPDATHEIVVKPDGTRQLRRRRFSGV